MYGLEDEDPIVKSTELYNKYFSSYFRPSAHRNTALNDT